MGMASLSRGRQHLVLWILTHKSQLILKVETSATPLEEQGPQEYQAPSQKSRVSSLRAWELVVGACSVRLTFWKGRGGLCRQGRCNSEERRTPWKKGTETLPGTEGGGSRCDKGLPTFILYHPLPLTLLDETIPDFEGLELKLGALPPPVSEVERLTVLGLHRWQPTLVLTAAP